MIELSSGVRIKYIQKLADLFKSEPSIYPNMWIACYNVTEAEENFFFKLISQ